MTQQTQIESESSPLWLMFYMSDYVGDGDINEELAQISAVSKVNNAKQDITGVLLYHNKTFLQVLEGQHAEITSLMTKIAKDCRHENIQVLIDEPIGQKSFQTWNMESFNLDSQSQIEFSSLIKVKELFTAQCNMDGWLFTETLKDFLADAKL
jgi:hypothetical protein